MDAIAHPRPGPPPAPRRTEPRVLGVHCLLDLSGIAPGLLADPDALGARLVAAARDGGATVVEHHLHRFEPHGVSGVVILAESHLALHTWPEHGFAAVDVFTCGHPAVAEAVAERIVAALRPRSVTRRRLDRGDRTAG